MTTQKRKMRTFKFFNTFLKNDIQRKNFFFNNIAYNKNKTHHISYDMFKKAIFWEKVKDEVKFEIYAVLLEKNIISFKDYPNLHSIF